VLTLGMGLHATLKKFTKFLQVPTSASSTLKMKGAGSFETLVNFYLTLLIIKPTRCTHFSNLFLE